MLTPKVHVTDEGNVRVLAARGEFVGGNETDELRDALARESEQDTRRLLIDLEGVTYLNSSALGVLISAHTNFSKRGSVLGLCNISEGIKNIFVITKLSLVFNVYGSRKEGVAALANAEQEG